MKKLSTGANSTLGEYRKLTAALLGEDSPATKFLDDKIKEQGEDAEVIKDEGQMVYLLGQIHIGAASQ
ncbi:hypothetical protein D3C76_28390 [compost metagenome]